MELKSLMTVKRLKRQDGEYFKTLKSPHWIKRFEDKILLAAQLVEEANV